MQANKKSELEILQQQIRELQSKERAIQIRNRVDMNEFLDRAINSPQYQGYVLEAVDSMQPAFLEGLGTDVALKLIKDSLMAEPVKECSFAEVKAKAKMNSVVEDATLGQIGTRCKSVNSKMKTASPKYYVEVRNGEVHTLCRNQGGKQTDKFNTFSLSHVTDGHLITTGDGRQVNINILGYNIIRVKNCLIFPSKDSSHAVLFGDDRQDMKTEDIFNYDLVVPFFSIPQYLHAMVHAVRVLFGADLVDDILVNEWRNYNLNPTEDHVMRVFKANDKPNYGNKNRHCIFRDGNCYMFYDIHRDEKLTRYWVDTFAELIVKAVAKVQDKPEDTLIEFFRKNVRFYSGWVDIVQGDYLKHSKNVVQL